jgi:dienelactone hydrolase
MSPTARTVSFQGEKDQLRGYLVRPGGDGPFPGVVVIHEIFGLNDNIRNIALRFAGEGYAALAVDLFAGRNRAVCMARLWAVCCSNRWATVASGISKRRLASSPNNPE